MLGDKNKEVSKEWNVQWDARVCLVRVGGNKAGSLLLKTKVRGKF